MKIFFLRNFWIFSSCAFLKYKVGLLSFNHNRTPSLLGIFIYMNESFMTFNYQEAHYFVSSTLNMSACLIDCPKTSEKKTFDEEVNEIRLFVSVVRLRNIICNSNFREVKNTQNILLPRMIELHVTRTMKRILPLKLFHSEFCRSFSEKDFTFYSDVSETFA